ncbi:mitogen-activated protein kinase kinase kinase, partial [Coemansia nantahalensis]
NSAHVEVDELPFVRPGQTSWVSPPPPPFGASRSSGQVRRRSAVIESPEAGVTAPLPARYHGTNHAHSPYYAHGAATTRAYGGRVAGGASVRSPPGRETGSAPARYQTMPAHHGTVRAPKPHARAVFEPPAAIRTAPLPPPPARAPPRTRRVSLSPVLDALQPGNYHIANLPDDSDGSSDGSPDGSGSSGEEGPAGGQRPAPGPLAGRVAAINTAVDYGDLASPCLTAESVVTPLSVVNVPTELMSGSIGRSGTGRRAMLQRAFGDDLEDLPMRPSRAGHARTPSMPTALDPLPLLRGPPRADAAAAGRPRSSHSDIRAVPTDESPTRIVFDAESIASGRSSSLRSPGAASAVDLVEGALSICEVASPTQSAVWDADELPDPGSAAFDAESVVFDAESMLDDDAAERMTVLIDAYEVASLASAEPETPGEASAMSVPVAQHGASSDGPLQQLPPPPTRAPPPPGPPQPQPRPPVDAAAFKVKGVRHVVTYGSDFDRTAATLLSSIKTDIAKKVAAAPGGRTYRPATPDAAQIAAAIEHHQQRQQQLITSPLSADRHTSRLSGLFSFGGPRTQPRPHAAVPSPPDSAPGAVGLRVDTDLHALRGAATAQPATHPAAISGNDVATAPDAGAPSVSPVADGRASASPSAPSRRWRVPFRQRPPAAPVPPGSDSSSSPARRLARPRDRAGTTSDVERAQATAARLADGERPHSMVESSSCGSSEASTPATAPMAVAPEPVTVLARWEDEREFHAVDISGLSTGTGVAERVATALLSPATASAPVTPLQQLVRRLPGGLRFGVHMADGSQHPLLSASELWSHCARARPDSPAMFVLYRGAAPPASAADVASGDEDGRQSLPAPPWAEDSDASDALSPLPPARPFSSADSPRTPLTGDSESAGAFAAARLGLAADPAAPGPDSWTLMFFSKEFVVPPGCGGGPGAGRGRPSQATLVSAGDGSPWCAPPGAAEPGSETPGTAVEPSQTAFASGEPSQTTDGDEPVERSGSLRELPSTMRFTRGMRATLLKRPSKRSAGERPTADVIGEQLDKYFPGHDLDRPIVQAVPVDAGLLPSAEFHIILDDTDGEAAAAARRLPAPPAVDRRKSVRMLVQETRSQRLQRRQQRRRAGGAADEQPQPPQVLLLPPPPPPPVPPGRDGSGERRPSAVVRRKSTKLWGCIPEEIHPARAPRAAALAAAAAAAAAAAGGEPHTDIVRRALSLLRRPESDPQAERDIVEAAMRSGDSVRAAGSTRAQFVQNLALQRAAEASGEAARPPPPLPDGGSVNDAVRALFAKYGLGPGGVRFQWIKGRQIGRGSFGHVHVAINAGTGEVIAVKQIRLPKTLRAADPGKPQLSEAVQMMYTEVELLRDLDHENIVQLLGFEVAGGLMSMFLEYVAGGTVQSLVQQHGPLHETVVHSFLAQITAGLAYLHDRSILHRDIKGANILVDETGTCRISDFGISRRQDHTYLAEAIKAPPIPDDLPEAGIDFCKNCFAAVPADRWSAAQLARMPFAQVAPDYEYPYCHDR